VFILGCTRHMLGYCPPTTADVFLDNIKVTLQKIAVNLCTHSLVIFFHSRVLALGIFPAVHKNINEKNLLDFFLASLGSLSSILIALASPTLP